MSERFDLEKWFLGYRHDVRTVDDALRAMREAVTAAENHQRELMEAELSRVRQQARAEALEQVAAKHRYSHWANGWELCECGDKQSYPRTWRDHIRSLIPAEAQGGPTYGVAEFNEHVESRVSERTQASLGVIELAAKGVKPLTDENDQRWSVAYLDVVELSERTKRLREALAVSEARVAVLKSDLATIAAEPLGSHEAVKIARRALESE